MKEEGDGCMKTVLVVEDERTTQRYYQTGLRGLMDWKVLVAGNGLEALQMLDQEPVHVVVTDLHMPGLGGVDLIRQIAEWYPSIPILVITGTPESEMVQEALTLGALRIHPKPVRLSWLMDEIRGMGERPPDGKAEGLPLASLLQMLHWERSDTTLTVLAPEGLGRLYVKEGELVQAACGTQRGLPAAFEILSFSRPVVSFMRACRVLPEIIMELAEILMEHSIQGDQAAAERAAATKVPETHIPVIQDPWSQGRPKS